VRDGFRCESPHPRVESWAASGWHIVMHSWPVLPGNDPKAIVLDLVQPLAAGWQFIVFVGRHGAMNPAGRVRCNMWTK
jgi:hypothetical protein